MTTFKGRAVPDLQHERWETGNGDRTGIYLRQPGQAGHVKIGDFGAGPAQGIR